VGVKQIMGGVSVTIIVQYTHETCWSFIQQLESCPCPVNRLYDNSTGYNWRRVIVIVLVIIIIITIIYDLPTYNYYYLLSSDGCGLSIIKWFENSVCACIIGTTVYIASCTEGALL